MLYFICMFSALRISVRMFYHVLELADYPDRSMAFNNNLHQWPSATSSSSSSASGAVPPSVQASALFSSPSPSNSFSGTEFPLTDQQQGSVSTVMDPHMGLMMLLEQRPLSRCGSGGGGNSLMQQMFAMQQQHHSHTQQQSRKLFIGGLGQVNDDALRQYYSQWGQVVDCIVIRDPATRSSRGFGFVTYATSEMAETAMSHRPHIINGKAVDAKRAVPRERMNLIADADTTPFFMNIEPGPGCRLLLSGLNWEWHTLDTLRTHFGQFGTVEQLEMVAYPRGCGSLVFEEQAAAVLCLAAGERHSVNGHPVEVKLADAHPPVRPNSSDSALSASSALALSLAAGHQQNALNLL